MTFRTMFTDESLQRIDKIRRMKDLGVIPYAAKFDKKDHIADIIASPTGSLRTIEEIVVSPRPSFKTAGRIVLYRSFGKISFAKLRDATGDIQIMFSRECCSIVNAGQESTVLKTASGEECSAFKFIEKLADVGDYIGIEGELFVTHKGELTIFVSAFTYLAKAIRPLPEKFHGIQDQEAIYRQRYLDLIMNQESYDRFLFKSRFYSALREFYTKEGFVELQTPILGNAASGAAAQPFITHHNDYDLDVYLRIAFEISLKKATVGRFEKVFEIGQDFRNEGSDPSHLQEFTQVEHYAAFWDYKDNMIFTERLFDFLFDRLDIPRKLKVKDKEGIAREVDFTTPWARIDYVEQIKKDSGIDVSAYSPDDTEKLLADIRSKGIEFEGMDSMFAPTLIDYLYKKVTRPKILGPAFIYNYPRTMQPLARVSDENSNIVEQFQLIVNGWEICKAYSELVDPLLQNENFEKQAQASQRGDLEATQGDDDFVLAMEHGMPPQSGFGMGLERILAILTEQDNLRDVVLFPLTKPESGQSSVQRKSKETKSAVIILNRSANLEKWQAMNTVAHLSSSFAARAGTELFLHDTILTADSEKINLNIQHAIVIKESPDQQSFLSLMQDARAAGMAVSEFTREMLVTTDDRKVIELTAGKRHQDIEYLGILLFGNKKVLDEMTKGFGLMQ